jgi:hypothetical protein
MAKLKDIERTILAVGVMLISALALYLSFLSDKTVFGVALGGVLVCLQAVIRHVFPSKPDKDQEPKV